MTPADNSDQNVPQSARLAWLLRLSGLIDFCAIVIVFLPMDWLVRVHQFTGAGSLPEEPIVQYLARSTSALYGLHGALLVFLSFDVARYRPLIRSLGGLAAVHGIILFFVDRQVGLPPWWQWAEGPTFTVTGLAILLLSRRRA